MKILITGGTGFLGVHLTEHLKRNGAMVRVADIKEAKQPIEGVEYCIGDMRSLEFCKKITSDVHELYNFAALPSIAHGKTEDYYQNNVFALEQLLKIAICFNIKKVLHMSSSTVYGIPRVCPIKESAPLKPIGEYSKSKCKAESICLQYRERGLNINIIRPRVILGPGRIGVFSILFDRIMRNQTIPMIGDGSNLFQFTSVEDLVVVSVDVMNKLQNETVNVGCQTLLPLRDELEALIRKAESTSRLLSIHPMLAQNLLRCAAWVGVSPLINDQFCIANKDFVLDTSKIQNLLGWRASRDNAETLYSAFLWYTKNHHKIETQYSSWAGLFGKFRHAKMGAYQN